MTVVPRDVRPYGLYGTLAVVAAFALWGFHPDDLPIETVRAWVSPLGTDYPGWLQLRRWADDAHRLPEISSGQPRSPPEQFARSVVQQIAASSPDGREFPLWKRAVWQAAPSNHAR